MSASVHLSIVSHRQAPLVSSLLADIAAFGDSTELQLTVLSNLPEAAPVVPVELAGKLEHITNDKPAGFGANHNKVFNRSNAPYFCVLNPDLRLPHNPFPQLLSVFADERVALAAPAACDGDGKMQDNARLLPTPWRIASKLWSRAGGSDYPANVAIAYPDCVAGFFMLLRSSAYRALDGFDERYFLYYEDFDLCSRIRLAGWKNAWLPGVKIVHHARRKSHGDLRYLIVHARSVARFFSSPVYRAARRLALPTG